MDKGHTSQLLDIIEKNPDGVVILDDTGKVRFINPAAEYLFDGKTEAILGSHIGRGIKSGISTEVQSVNGDGEPITVEVRVVKIDWENAAAYLISLRDMTDRKKMEQELRSSYQQLLDQQKSLIEEERLKVILQMSGAMVHELSQPLTSLLGNLELLEGSTQEAEEFDMCVAEIKKAGEKIADKVQKIQSIRRYDSKPYYDDISIININQETTILAIDDSDRDFIKLNRIIDNYGNIHLQRAKTLNQAHALLAESSYDLILLDYILPDGTGLDFLASLDEKDIDIPTVVITGNGNDVIASQFVKAGVYDYLPKTNVSDKSVARVISNALEKFHLKTELQKTIKKMEEMAARDELTGLYNRRYFLDAMERETAAARRYGKDVSLCLIEPDRLEEIINTYGREAANMILKEFAGIMTENTRKSDLLCRYSEKKLGSILTCTDMSKAQMFGERIREKIKAQKFEFDFPEATITISVGISSYSKILDQTPDALLEEAERNLKCSKEAGGDKVSGALSSVSDTKNRGQGNQKNNGVSREILKSQTP